MRRLSEYMQTYNLTIIIFNLIGLIGIAMYIDVTKNVPQLPKIPTWLEIIGNLLTMFLMPFLNWLCLTKLLKKAQNV